MAFNEQGGRPFTFGQDVDRLTRRTVRGVKGGLPIYEDTYGGLTAAEEKEIAMAPLNFRRDVFNKIFPLAGGAMGEGSVNFSQVGGTNTPMPTLPNSFVYSPQQVQQQVNSAKAQGAQGAATQKRQIASDISSRGFGGRSALAMALNQAADTGARARNADQEREIRFDAAGANARQDLAVGGLAQQGWNNWNQLDIERRKTQADSILNSQRNMAALIASLSGLA